MSTRSSFYKYLILMLPMCPCSMLYVNIQHTQHKEYAHNSHWSWKVCHRQQRRQWPSELRVQPKLGCTDVTALGADYTVQQKWDIDSSVCDLGVSDPGPTACFSKASISLCTAKHQEWYSAAVDSQTRMVMAQVLSNAFRLSLQCMDGPVFLVLDASSEKTVFDSHELSIWPHDLVAVLSWLMIQMSDGFEHHTIWHQVIHHESTTMSPFSVGNPVFLIYAHDLSETAEVELIKHFPVQFLDSLTFQF